MRRAGPVRAIFMSVEMDGASAAMHGLPLRGRLLMTALSIQLVDIDQHGGSRPSFSRER